MTTASEQGSIPSRPINTHDTAWTPSPADLADLRASVKGPLLPDTDLARPFVRFELDQTGVSGHWSVVQDGVVIARTAWGHIALWLLQQERLEAGYIKRVLDPSTDVTEAMLPPSQRLARQRERGAALAARREAARLADERRQSSLDQARAAQRLDQLLASGEFNIDTLLDPTSF